MPSMHEDAILLSYRESVGPLYAYVARRSGGRERWRRT